MKRRPLTTLDSPHLTLCKTFIFCRFVILNNPSGFSLRACAPSAWCEWATDLGHGAHMRKLLTVNTTIYLIANISQPTLPYLSADKTVNSSKSLRLSRCPSVVGMVGIGSSRHGSAAITEATLPWCCFTIFLGRGMKFVTLTVTCNVM